MENSQTDNEDLFAQYFDREIVPLVQETNRIKDRYRGRFWGSFWTVAFLCCVNALFVLFRTLLYGRPFSVEQFIFVFICAPFIIAWPLWSYKKQKQEDIFGVFLKFYGDWQHFSDKETTSADTEVPVVVTHQFAEIIHKIIGVYAGTDVEIRDTEYFNDKKKKGSGVMIDLTLPCDIGHEILMFEKSALHRKYKPVGVTEIGDQIHIPAAGYFSIFSADQIAPKQLLCSVFFENILDLKDDFNARKMSVWLKGKQIKIYLDGSRTYFDHSNIWSKKIDEMQYRRLHQQIEHVFRFIEMMQELLAQDKR